MKSTTLAFRKMASEDAAHYRTIRLQALTDNPEAFGATVQEERSSDLEVFRERLAYFPIFGAFDGDEIVGMVGLHFDQRKDFHIRQHCGDFSCLGNTGDAE